MKLLKKPTTFGLIVGSRGFFNSELAIQGRKDILAKLDSLGYRYVIPEESATPNGAIETYADAKLCAEYFRKHQEEIDGVVVILPNFGDELGVVHTLDMARLKVPVLVQACNDEDPEKLLIAERRDAFCGKISVCSNLYQFGIPFTDTTSHTCRIDSEEFANDLDHFSRVCRVVKGLTHLRVGAIGARPAAFHTCRYSEKLLQGTGVTVVTVDLSDIIARAKKLLGAPSEAVDQKMVDIRGYGTIALNILDEKVLKQACWSVALDGWLEENDCDASAIQCWTSVQENFGCATCLSMSMMGERFMPSACEMDVPGVVSMVGLLLASGNPPGFLDWNNNYGTDQNKCINTHCSNFPKSFVGGDIEISNLDVLGAALGEENCFGGIKAKVKEGAMTYFRMSTDDREGKIRSYVGEGNFTEDPNTIQGGSAVCEIPELRQLLKFLCKNGFEHHVAMTRGHYGKVLHEAVDTYLDWDVYYHEEHTS